MTHTPGPWMVATSNSWRRIVSRDHGNVCEPITQNDGHPDLRFKNGGEDGPDARLLAAAPDLRALLAWALRQFGPPVRRITGQNEEYYDNYMKAKALLDAIEGHVKGTK